MISFVLSRKAAVFSFLRLDKDGMHMGFMTTCGCLSGRGCGLYFILLGLDINSENYLMPMERLTPYIWSLNTGVSFSLNISWVLSAPPSLGHNPSLHCGSNLKSPRPPPPCPPRLRASSSAPGPARLYHPSNKKSSMNTHVFSRT